MATAFRFWGITQGYPPYHSDEGMSYSQGIAIIQEKTLDAHGYTLHYAYPGLIPLLNAVAFKILFIPLAWIGYYLSNAGNFIDGVITFPLADVDRIRIYVNDIVGIREVNVLIWGRILSAFFGVMCVYLTYLLAKRLYNERTGIIAAVLVAVNYRHVLNSHFALPDIYNAFFLLVSLVLSLRLVTNPSKKTYLFAGLGVGLFLSTKFHIYSILPFIICHIYAQKAKIWELKKIVLVKELYIAGIAGLLTLVVLNPWHAIHFEEFIYQLSDVSIKYRTGKNSLDLYLYSYLYHWGVGTLTSLLVLGGIIASYFANKKSFIILLSVIIPFFYVVTFYTGGGFYTRNAVTIIPFILLIAAVGLNYLFNRRNILIKLIAVLLLVISVYENVTRDIVVASEYSKPWNITLTRQWIIDNLEDGSIIAAHSSVPLDNESLVRQPYTQGEDFSIQEFLLTGADYAIVNLDWATTDFYWWMAQDLRGSLTYWNKPISELEQTYSALVLRELQDYAIYSQVNDALAPDSDFVVAKIPDTSYTIEENVFEFNFDESSSIDDDWKSDLIPVQGVVGVTAEFDARFEGSLNKDGYVYVEYYHNEEDAIHHANRIAVRISPRIESSNLETITFSHRVPKSAIYARIRIGTYDKSHTKLYFDKLTLYKSRVIEDFGKWSPSKVTLPEGVIFPNSHGNL